MVKNYLVVVGIVWLIVHCAFSWDMPDAWIGMVVLIQSVAFSLLNYDNEVVSRISFVPLAILILLGMVDETVMRVFFRCFSEGEAHGFSTLLTGTFSIMLFPSFFCVSRVLKGIRGRCLICAIAVLTFASGSWMFDCDVVVWGLLFLMLLSVFIRDFRGLVFIVACGFMMVLMGECSRLTSRYLVVKCMAPRCRGWVYELWVLSLCEAYVFLWWRSMKDDRKGRRGF